MRSALGMSVGATRLTAVTADNTVSWPPVVTLNRGLVIGDFVDRVGDPIAILAADGSSHRSEELLADALRALAYSATGGRSLPDVTAVSFPAHWRPAAVEALRRALRQVPEWSRGPVTMLPDVVAATTALSHDPGLPARGVIAVCDVGGSGTSVSLVDADAGYRPIGPVVRHVDFSGDLVDQAILTHVIGDLAGAGSVDLASTSAIGSLGLLRVQCRGAKERLAAGAVTALPVELPGYRGDVRFTRDELDDAVRAPLRDLVELIQDTMRRNGVRPGDLVAAATVGGGAGMAAVTTALSEHLRVPVITTARPAQSAAIGAALRALRGPDDDSATAMATAAPATMAAAIGHSADPAPVSAALAWSQADDLPELELSGLELADYDGPGPLTSARPQIAFEEEPVIAPAAERKIQWYRSPLAVMAAAVIVIAGAVSAVGVVLASDSMTTPASTPTPSVTETPAAPAPDLAADAPPAAPQPAPQQQDSAPAPAQSVRTITAVPAPVTQTQVVQQAAPAPEAPAPVTVTETAPPQTEIVTPSPEPAPPATEAPPPSAQPPVEQPAPTSAPPQWVPRIPNLPAIPTIPGLPQVFQPAVP